MKYIGMPMGMWMLFRKSFEHNLITEFGMDRKTAKTVAAKAKPRYEEIIAGLPEFEREDRFKMNIVNCALLSAFVLTMPERPDVKRLTTYYAASMMTPAMKWFCRKSGKSKFSDKDIFSMKATERLRAADRNPYSWNMEFYPYPDGSGYEARFSVCGICTLMRELGLYDLVPAMCRLDYTMSEAGGAADFVREYTLASGGPYCDCGYKKKHIKMLDESKKMKIIKKTVADILGDAETERIWDTARERVREILSHYKNIPLKEQMHTNLIFPHIAVYKSLLENHSNMAMEIMEKGETAAAEKTVKLFKKVVKFPLGKAMFLKGFAAGCKTGFGSDAGFRHDVYRADSKCYQMDVTACPYMKYCNAEDCGELTRIFCDIDVYAYGYLDGITFERSQTLGTGGEKCDFHLYSAK